MMEAYREIIDASRLMSVMNIPNRLQNSRVEVIVLPLQSATTLVQSAESMMGCLKDYANPALIEQEKSAWELHLKEKYGTL
jgi:hypothetical protein